MEGNGQHYRGSLARRLICGQINHHFLARQYCLHSDKVFKEVLNGIMA